MTAIGSEATALDGRSGRCYTNRMKTVICIELWDDGDICVSGARAETVGEEEITGPITDSKIAELVPQAVGALHRLQDEVRGLKRPV